MGLDPVAVGVAEEGNAAKNGGEEDLHRPMEMLAKAPRS